LVVNAGTCITYDLVDAQGVYRGGSIAPGLQMRFKALPQFTAKLPLIEAQPMPIDLTGRSTETAIRTGVQWGMVHEVDGFIEAYRRLYPELRVVLAGGDATYFETTLKNSIFAQPNLVLLGLYQILVYNVQQTPFPPAAL
jgi:type III pantothenate kinase